MTPPSLAAPMVLSRRCGETVCCCLWQLQILRDWEGAKGGVCAGGGGGGGGEGGGGCR